jgi:chromosome partitioning protein
MIISVATQKGGTGKTTTSISIAAGLGRKGKKVLLIDVDAQANSSKVLLPNYSQLDETETIYRTVIDRQPLPVYPTTVPNLDIAPSHILLSNTDIELTTAKDHREARIRNQLIKIQNQYDHIIFDCPPAISWLTLNAFSASNKVLVIVSPGSFELDSTVQIGKTIEEAQTYYNPELKLLGYLFTMSDPTVNSRTSLQILRQTYTNKVLKTVIPRNTDIRDAHFQKTDIFSFNPNSKSAQAYAALIEELGL